MKNLLHNYLQKNTTAWEAWFSPLRITHDSASATVSVTFPHVFFQAWFATHGQAEFETAVNEIFLQEYNKKATILYINPSPLNTKPVFLQNIAAPKNRTYFDDFLYNKKNAFPLAAAKEVASNSIPLKYNPFFLHGKSSTGKTHILKAIQQGIIVKAVHIFTGTAEDFCDMLTQNGAVLFNTLYTAFIIDDFHRIPKEASIQEQIMRFIDLCKEQQKQLIFASRRPPNASKVFLEALSSRLGSGLVVTLTPSDIDIRMRYAQTECVKSNIKISRDQLLFLAQHCTNIAQLSGIILKIKAVKDFSSTELSYADIEKIFHTASGKEKQLQVKDILSLVASHFQMAQEELFTEKRLPHIVQARQIAMFLCRDLLGISYPAIGKIFGGKDHSTVMYAVKKIKKITLTNKDMHKIVTQLKQECLAV